MRVKVIQKQWCYSSDLDAALQKAKKEIADEGGKIEDIKPFSNESFICFIIIWSEKPAKPTKKG